MRDVTLELFMKEMHAKFLKNENSYLKHKFKKKKFFPPSPLTRPCGVKKQGFMVIDVVYDITIFMVITHFFQYFFELP